MQVSLKTIARIAGVTEATVSMALRHTGTVSARRREQILEIARRLNYTPNFAARGLSTGRSQLIGVVAATFYTEISSLLLSHFEKEIRTQNYHLLGAFHQGNAQLEEQVLRDMIGRKVDGVVGFPVVQTRCRAWQLLHEAKIPFVIFNETAPFAHHEVGIDFEHGARLMVDHLVSLGRRHLAFVCTGSRSPSVKARQRGWRAACKAHGIKWTPDRCFFTEKHGHPELLQEIAGRVVASPLRPDGLCAANDQIATALLQALHRQGRTVPDEVAVVGFDDTEFSRLLPQPLTTVRQPIAEFAKRAAAIVLQQIDQPDTDYQRVLLPPELVVRETTVKPPGDPMTDAG
ncbi:MAG TPA: LacI family DNA-binding transcriptional regulator [Chthoniobacteraceae bacterium]|nr:LacI family DNA-binding transcriptional regulator [Chthoniobacteraceae bacterium]